VYHAVRAMLFATLFLFASSDAFAQATAPMPAEADPAKIPAMKADVDAAKAEATAGVTAATTAAHKYADISWMLVSCALVMLMMPGLALFYGGMARRKNVLATMMQTMVCLGLVGVQWMVIGYSLAFGAPAVKFSISSDSEGKPVEGGLIGFSKELMFLSDEAAVPKTEDDIYASKKIDKAKATDEQKADVAKALEEANKFNSFPNTNLPLYVHAMFQGMFAIITVALVSGAFAERVKFSAYLLFGLIWTTVVYDPLAHMVWSFDWNPASKVDVALAPGTKIFPAAGLLGVNGAIDFAGGTVVHIAAGFSGLAACLVLRKRLGHGKQTFHPNSMVLTLLGAGLLWFGWFGFNGGSALFCNGQAISAFTVTQIAAGAAAMSWMIVEWLHRGKPTGLGFASGLVAGLVAITPASGFVYPGGALAIGLLAGVVCYWAVAAKSLLGYDDSLDAFGVHGVGGMLGAILTAFFVSLPLWAYGAEMPPGAFPGKTDVVDNAIVYNKGLQLTWQIKASLLSAGYAFLATIVIVLLIDKTIGFTVKDKDEAIGLDLSQHGEVGVDVGPEVDAIVATKEPKAAATPPVNGGGKKFAISVSGATEAQLIEAWSKLCQGGDTAPSKEFTAVYPYVTTVSGNTFRFRGGDSVAIKTALQKLFADKLGGSVTATVV
jgi:ammonium transporter, Amt family